MTWRLRMLVNMGLLLRQEVGRQAHYRVNGAHPVHAELAQLLRKDGGGRRAALR